MSTEWTRIIRNYVDAASRPGGQNLTKPRPAITISRESGAGALAIADLVGRQLDLECPGDPARSWTVFDRNLVTKILEEHDLAGRIQEFMPEDCRFPLSEAFEYLLGLHPPAWTLREYAKDTIQKLAIAGNVILVGRGGAMITAGLPNVLRVRLVAQFEFRVKNYANVNGMSVEKAARAVRAADASNRHYVASYLRVDVSDPVYYDVVINTQMTGFQRAARIICRALQELIPDRCEQYSAQ
jgi:hypothetical protein